jgi:hypothetical protein
MWSIQRTYVGATKNALEWLRAAGVPVWKLEPPTVSKTILSVSFEMSEKYAGEFESWAATAKVAVPEKFPEGSEFYGELPDRKDLMELKWLAEQIKAPVAHYAAETFGGHFEYELGCEFGVRERILWIADRAKKTEETKRNWLGQERTIEKSRSHNVLLCFENGEIREVSKGNDPSVLPVLLQSFGIETKSYWAPHVRGFDWGKYRVK